MPKRIVNKKVPSKRKPRTKKTKVKKKRNTLGKEAMLQIACVKYFHKKYPKAIITSNGDFRNGREAGNAKRLGYHCGLPDLMVFKAKKSKKRIYTGLAIELKIPRSEKIERENKDVKPHQKRCLKVLRTCGWATFICRTESKFRKIVDNYMNCDSLKGINKK